MSMMTRRKRLRAKRPVTPPGRAGGGNGEREDDAARPHARKRIDMPQDAPRPGGFGGGGRGGIGGKGRMENEKVLKDQLDKRLNLDGLARTPKRDDVYRGEKSRKTKAGCQVRLAKAAGRKDNRQLSNFWISRRAKQEGGLPAPAAGAAFRRQRRPWPRR